MNLMNQDRLPKLAVYVLTGLSVIVFFWWLLTDPTRQFISSLPGSDNRGGGASVNDSVKIGSLFTFFINDYTQLNETWPRFRGAGFDNISRSPVPLKDKFGSNEPEILWTVEMGEGYSGAAIYKGLVYVLDYDEKQQADLLRCFSLLSGKEQWRRGYKVHVKRNHGMSRTIPALTDSFIVTIGPKCHVMCVGRIKGDFRWGIDIEKEYKSEIPLWYTGQCPLIDGNTAVIATGGTALMIGVDPATGKKVWETPNPKNWKMSHSSIMPYVFGGRKMYVYSAIGGLAGIAADGPETGKILWETSAWNKTVIASSPVCMPDGKIFISASYGAGSMVFQLKQNGEGFSVSPLADNKPSEGLASELQTPLYWNGHLFAIMPKDGGSLRNQLVCVDPSNTRKMVWSSGPDKRFGLGPYFMADNKIFLLNEEGTLYILKPSVSRYIESDAAKVISDGQDAWAPLALADGYMVLRDSKKMICLNLRK
jgi:outer membrane protein assembly factor BamB